MLTLFTGRRSDHPFDDKKARREFLQDGSRMMPLAIVAELSSHLDSIKTAERLKPARAVEIADFIRTTGEPLVMRLKTEFLSSEKRLTKFQHGRLWNTVYAYYAQLAEAYCFCLSKYQVGAVGSEALKLHLSRITCIALRACSAQVEWTFLRQGTVEQRIWQSILNVYRLAQLLGVAQIPATLHTSKTTPEREFLRPLMLATASPDALLTAKLQVAIQVIEQLGVEFRISAAFERGVQYAFDLSGRHPPGRYSTERTAETGAIYFGPGNASTKLAEMIELMSQDRTAPTELGKDVPAAMAHATLRHLIDCWSPVLRERKNPRRRHTERVTVVHEFEEVAAGVGGLFFDSPFVSNEEEWEIENESANGFGAFVPQPNGSWLKVGSLIGMRREEGAAWSAGVVRRMTVDEKETRYVGIEILGHGGTAVTIKTASLSAKGSSIRPEGELCVLLPAEQLNSGEVVLLMRACLFSLTERLLMHVYDRHYALVPIALVQQTEEFDLGRYRIVMHDREGHARRWRADKEGSPISQPR